MNIANFRPFRGRENLLYDGESRSIEIKHRSGTCYSVTYQERGHRSMLLGGLERITPECWTVRWVHDREIPPEQRSTFSKEGAIEYLITTVLEPCPQC